jgi:hypothetical protein
MAFLESDRFYLSALGPTGLCEPFELLDLKFLTFGQSYEKLTPILKLVTSKEPFAT